MSGDPDRMPAIERMTAAQREVAALIASGRRGDVSGPFVPALRSPEFARRLQHLGEYLRYDSALPPRIREIVILLTAQLWSQPFEWSVHVPIALEAGLGRATVEDIGAGSGPPGCLMTNVSRSISYASSPARTLSATLPITPPSRHSAKPPSST